MNVHCRPKSDIFGGHVTTKQVGNFTAIIFCFEKAKSYCNFAGEMETEVYKILESLYGVGKSHNCE